MACLLVAFSATAQQQLPTPTPATTVTPQSTDFVPVLRGPNFPPTYATVGSLPGAVSSASLPQAAQSLFLTLNPKQFGAIGDGTIHTLSSLGYTAAQAQAKCPEYTSLSDSIDWCATQQIIDLFEASNNGNLGTTGVAGGGQIHFPASVGCYAFNETFVSNNVALLFDGDDPGATCLNWTVASQDGIHHGLNNQRVLLNTPSLAAGGSGCTINGAQVMTLSGGTGTAPTLNVTVTANAVASINSVASGGNLSVLPAATPAALTGDGCTGATVTLSSTQFSNPGGPLSIKNLTATNTAVGGGGVFAKATFGFSLPSTGSWEHDLLGQANGSWTQIAQLTSPSNFEWHDVRFGGTLGTSTAAVEIFAPQTGVGHFQYNWIDNYCTKFAICWKYHMQGGPAIQGVTYTGNQTANVGDMVQIVLDAGYSAIAPPQWMFTNNWYAGEGFMLNCQTNCFAPQLIGNGVLLGNGIAGLTPPAEGGLFFQAAGGNARIFGNTIDTLNTDVATVVLLDSNGVGGSAGGNAVNNTAGAATAIAYKLGSSSSGWTDYGEDLAAGVTAVSNSGGVLDGPTYEGVLTLANSGGLVNQAGSSLASRTVTGDWGVGANDQYIGTNFSAPHTVTLPASPSGGRTFCVSDVGGTSGSQTATISGNGHNIAGSASVTLTSNYSGECLYYSSGTTSWGIIASWPGTTVSGDVITGTGSGGGIKDSGTPLSSFAPLASPTFTGTPTLPAGTINQEAHVITSNFSSTGTGLATLTGLDQAFTAAGLYSCNGQVHFTTAPTSSNGAKIALVGDGTVTVNTEQFTAWAQNGFAAAPVVGGTATSLGSTAFASSLAMTDVFMSATLNINVAGTIHVQMAENAASGTIAATAGNARWDCHRAA